MMLSSATRGCVEADQVCVKVHSRQDKAGRPNSVLPVMRLRASGESDKAFTTSWRKCAECQRHTDLLTASTCIRYVVTVEV